MTLDMGRTGYFKKEDLDIFLNYMHGELQLSDEVTISENMCDELLLVSGIKDNRINETLLRSFLQNYFEKMLAMYKMAAGITY